MLRTRALVAAMFAMTTLGCGAAGDDRVADDSSTSTKAASGTVDDAPDVEAARAEAQRRLDAAVQRMVNEPATAFEHRVEVYTRPAMATTGVADATGWHATTEFFDTPQGGEPSAVMLTRSTDGAVWMQMAGWKEPVKGCWLEVGPTASPLGIVAMTADSPHYINVLPEITVGDPTSAGADAVQGTLDVAAALSLWPGRLVQQIDVDPEKAAVRMRVAFADERVSEILLDGGEVARAVDEAGGELTDDARRALAAMSVTLRFPPAGDDTATTPPPADQVFTKGETGC